LTTDRCRDSKYIANKDVTKNTYKYRGSFIHLTLQHLTTSTLIAKGNWKGGPINESLKYCECRCCPQFRSQKNTKTLHKMWSRYNYKMMTLSLSFIHSLRFIPFFSPQTTKCNIYSLKKFVIHSEFRKMYIFTLKPYDDI